MARNLYGCTSADFAQTSTGRMVAGAGPFPVFDAFEGGTAITDLTDLDGNAITQVTFADDGYLRYYSPDNDKRVHWLDTGQGRRVGIRPVDLTGETGLTPDLSIGTVTTGTADVTKSGTLEAPVFSFVLPSAGANGVNTAALQDNAVTADKIAADAVGSSEIAANAVGTSEIADDAVTAAKIAAGAVGTSELADGAVTAAKIAADTITAGNIAANAVGSSELADNAVDTAAIADSAVTPAKLATSGRFVFPTGAANGYGFASGAVHLSGTGAPEGVVTAAPGSTWLQTDATTDVKDWIRWVKATGTGNTGWVAGPEADTGWRSLSSLIATIPTLTLDHLGIRRVGATVALRVSLADTSTAETTLLSGAIPSGFRPPTILSTISNRGGVLSLSDHASWQVLATGSFVYGVASVSTYSNEITWITADSWPSSLPGSAA